MCHRARVVLIIGLVVVATAAAAETPVESNVDSRLMLAFAVASTELQAWVPAPWRVGPVPAGPMQGANLFVVFIHRLLVLTPDGKPSASGGTDRAAVIVVPAKHPDIAEQALFVARIYASDDRGLPGPYKNSVKASVRRELVVSGENLEPGAATDAWEVRDASGGAMTVRLSYQRSLPARANVEQKIRSAVDPAFFRIYRFDQGAELVKSVPAGIDRLKGYEFRSTIPELAKVLDGGQQLVGIAAIPWYVRQVSLP